ncbi:hypothetical protein JRI60_10945 [Archangium violaceum]|uniref:hypothetical protein n=1 Tax=Archangium violaceum TaxID=83451 RepID=UPI001951AFD1|nr:hypothetical protein [Archangium violaceum]QRN99494.1 hypothetical protein JRI60_10945 [Archangium violaceum]
MSLSEPHTNALLQPTLTESAPQQALLSQRATFLTAFFGGPWAALYVMAANFRRLGRLDRAMPVLAAAALLGVVALVVSFVTIARPDLAAEWMPSGVRSSLMVRRGNNLLGMLAWGACYLPMRAHFRAADMSSLGYARPWGTVVPALLVAMLVHGAVVGLAVFLR